MKNPRQEMRTTRRKVQSVDTLIDLELLQALKMTVMNLKNSSPTSMPTMGSLRRVVWAVWSPSDKPGTKRMNLANVPGYLISSSRISLTDAPAPDGGAVEITLGQIELEVGGSPVYLMLGP
jgi:hypothetical protein